MSAVLAAAARRAGVDDERVLAAVAEVPRGAYVSSPEFEIDAPLPIGQAQTTSQPSLIARCLQELRLDGAEKVLEVGAGCGYQTALLARLARRVVALDLLEDLARVAADNLRAQGVDNAEVRQGDGWEGVPEEAPFDAIVVAAAASRIPQALLDQLAPGGRMVIPVGPGDRAELTLVTKGADGWIAEHDLLAVRFVPLVRRRPGS